MAGMRDLLPLMAQAIASDLSISWSQAPGGTLALADVKIMGSTDPTYGAVGWMPNLSGAPFATLAAETASDVETEPNRIWATYAVRVFIGIEHSDTPAVVENYNDQALAWMDAARPFVASHRRLGPGSTLLWPTSGDVRWKLRGSNILPVYDVYGQLYYGVLLNTDVQFAVSVNYQS